MFIKLPKLPIKIPGVGGGNSSPSKEMLQLLLDTAPDSVTIGIELSVNEGINAGIEIGATESVEVSVTYNKSQAEDFLRQAGYL